MTDALPPELAKALSGRRDRLEVFERIAPRSTALLVIDMQKAWTEPGAPWAFPEARTIIDNVNRLAGALRGAGGAVVWVQHATGAPGTPGYWSNYLDHFVSGAQRETALAAIQEGSPYRDLDPALDVDERDLRIVKRRYSAMVHTSSDLEPELKRRDVDTVIVTGVQTNMCVESTARDAMMLDFKVFMPRDAVAARTPEDHLAGLRTVAQVFADIRATAELVDLIAANARLRTP